MAESTAQSVVTDEMRALVGVEGPETTLEVTSTGCRLFARAVGHTDPIFYDRAAAQERGYRDVVAPPGFLGSPVYGPEEREAGPRLPVPYRRTLYGGRTCEYVESICAGDVLLARMRITKFQEREGSIGPMLIVSRETTYRRPDGTLVARTQGSLIHY